MSYLWDKKGDGDPGARELESLLAGEKFSGMAFPPVASARRGARRALLAVAAVLIAACAVFVVLRPRDVVTVRGEGRERTLANGEWLEPKSNVTLALAREIGVVEVRGDSRLRVQRVDGEQQRLELERGHLHAVVNAPPRLFVVDTPSGRAVDLGCEYTLEVQRDGSTRIDVLSGRVVLEGAGRTTTVLAGMWAVSRPGAAPQVAIDTQASPAFVSAVQRLSSGEPDVLGLVLAQADKRDAVTLWQLRSRTENETRELVDAKLRELVAVPASAPDEKVWEACGSVRQ
ncbi:MAG: FecR domain-containing protein [Archangium sp.]|nr:FecR domain-containing protein [Archangium sp.]